MSLKTRLEQVEKRARYFKHEPVLFIQSSDELEQKRHRIGPDTVVFLYEWEEDEPDIPECRTVIHDDIEDKQ